MSEATLTSRRIIKQGLLMKRCRWSWRPRFIEIISDPPDFSGPLYSFFLLIFDQSHRNVKKRIRIQDIVTIRSGKRYSFQIYLNSGMFLLFRTESMEAQAAWMAELKMALGRGNIFHVQVSTPADNFVLDHALLYCIGVNLPNHNVGQLDRVLVVASAINDVNLHAWNLSRVKRFMIIEAGIQMELCGNCMGHRKKTVTFLISPEFIKDCVEFLVKEARLHSEPKQMAGDGPLYYTSPHSCSSVVAESPTATTCPTYTNAEMIVLGKDNGQKLSASTGVYINYDGRGRSFSTSTCTSPSPQGVSGGRGESSGGSGSKSATMQPQQNPLIPPRNIMRKEDSVTSNVGQASAGLLDSASSLSTTTTTTTMTTTTTHHFDNKPYQINHRIYVNEDGGMKEDSHVFGSGTWEHEGRNNRSFNKPPMAPPRTDELLKPVYVEDNDIHTPPISSPLNPPPGFKRPEFIGRNPPCLPPRSADNTDPSPFLSCRSTSDSNLLSGGYSPDTTRRNSEYPSSIYYNDGWFNDGSSLTQPAPYSSDDKPPSYQNVGEWKRSHTISSGTQRPPIGPTYVNHGIMRSPSPQMCTDDISNADFALITKLSFTSGVVLPPRNQPRNQPSKPPAQQHQSQQQLLATAASRRPVPVPRNKNKDQSGTVGVSNTVESELTNPKPSVPTKESIDVEDIDNNNNKKETMDEKNTNKEESSKEKVNEERIANDDEGMSINPLYFNVGAGRTGNKRHPKYGFSAEWSTHSSTAASSLREHTFEVRCTSFSSSSLDSDDYKRHSRSRVMADVQRQYSHEV